MVIAPVKSSAKLVSIPRWQRVWIDSHNAINFSGLVQELVTEIIRVHDPTYFEANKKFMDIQLIRKKEVIDQLVKSKPIITKI